MKTNTIILVKVTVAKEHNKKKVLKVYVIILFNINKILKIQDISLYNDYLLLCC